jgi:hypothetical protein
VGRFVIKVWRLMQHPKVKIKEEGTTKFQGGSLELFFFFFLRNSCHASVTHACNPGYRRQRSGGLEFKAILGK